jgi:hypothetical protein
MQQIVAHVPLSSQDFLFCPVHSDLARLEARERAKLATDATPRRSASFAGSLAKILRRRHQHTLSCSCCLLCEVFHGSVSQ